MGITKTGNSHVRRVLVESAWNARYKLALGYKLRKRRGGACLADCAYGPADTEIIPSIFLPGGGGEPWNKIVATVARELVGFIWGMLQEGAVRHEAQRDARIINRVRRNHSESRRIA
jgi:transposase